ncbi:unnamed protein product [Symbiodinium natans]|uniref:Uncharacterized protein n=1 Tax=Symbiodinium natans TaxID=878477 RepID=A0A812MH14_9DINO|nr:unnamed protein product [Symbiodinium natans]
MGAGYMNPKQSTVLKSTLLFGFVVAVLVEGFPSPENTNERFIDVFVFTVSWAICCLFQSIVLAGLYQVVQTRALREMIRGLQTSSSSASNPFADELTRSTTMDSGALSGASISAGSSLSTPDLLRSQALPDQQRITFPRPYALLHPAAQRFKQRGLGDLDVEAHAPRHLKRCDTDESINFGPASGKEPGSPVPTLHVFDPKRLLYRSQAKQFVTFGSLFTLICLAGLIYGRLSMRRGSKHGEGSSDVCIRLGIFLPPFISATFSLMLRKHANPIRATLAVQSLSSLCFFLSLACLAITTIWWHASAPSINLARTHGAEETYLKGISLQVDGWPIFFHPTGVAVSGNSLFLSAAFRIARFRLAGGVARLESETTFPGLEIGDISFCGNQSAVNSSLALAGRDTIAVLATEVVTRSARVTWRDLPNASFGRSIQDPLDTSAESLQALSYWPQQDMLVVSKADLGVVACQAHDEERQLQSTVQAEMMIMEKFAAGTSVSGLHVDPIEEVLYVLFHRSGRHAEIHAIDLRDELGRLLRILRLPDVDAADGPDADHDVVWGALSTYHPMEVHDRPQLLAVTRTPAKVFSFDLPNLRQCGSESLCKSAANASRAVAELKASIWR